MHNKYLLLHQLKIQILTFPSMSKLLWLNFSMPMLTGKSGFILGSLRTHGTRHPPRNEPPPLAPHEGWATHSRRRARSSSLRSSSGSSSWPPCRSRRRPRRGTGCWGGCSIPEPGSTSGTSRPGRCSPGRCPRYSWREGREGQGSVFHRPGHFTAEYPTSASSSRWHRREKFMLVSEPEQLSTLPSMLGQN